MRRVASNLCLSIIALSAPTFAQDMDSAVPVVQTTGGTAVAPSSANHVQLLLGDLVDGPHDVSTNITASPSPGTLWNRLLGVARAWGYYWVSGGAGTTGAFMIHQYDLNGVYIQSFLQDVSNSTNTIWGARDLAVDEANFKLWGGMENNQLKEYTFTPSPGGGPNGTLAFTVSYTIPLNSVIVIRALARNPNTGNFYTKNFNSAMFEFDISPLSQVAVLNSNGKATYGLAYDTQNDTLWGFDQFPVSATDACEFNETDLTGVLTGRTFSGTLYGVANTNVSGGCDIFNDGSGVLKIVGLHQYTNDELNIYELDPTVTPPFSYCTAGTSTNGCLPAMSFSGTPSAAATSGFNLICNGLEGAKQGIHFYGISGQNNSPWGSGSPSFLCVKPPTQRMINQNSGGTVNTCNGSMTTDFLAFIAANPGALGAPLASGQTVNAQTWYRDPSAPKSTNLSDGLEFTVVP